MKRMKRLFKISQNKKSMLDLGKWMNRSSTKGYNDDYYEKHLHKVQDVDIRSKIINLYKNGNALEKSIALSVLAIYDIYN